jgi:heat shock protein HslJ
MIRSVLLFVAVSASLALVACAGLGGNELQDTAWELESLAGDALIPITKITIEYTADQVSGSAGCNTYGGTYEISGDNLTVIDLYATEMGCLEPAGILEQESAYLDALRNATTYEVNGGRLVILDETGAEILVYKASP